ncbi:hypothetical protein [Legionella waltersii]|uniref:Uncharacterized protein n=1 Tax=Legionella waltersii TaxID=66969 RepID=A0A0W1A4J6_9GAMM|nr:hypothetical protein [Legionella waltersii]KTD76285.1 hypothetical protein Lwal_2007 [Legionella waltersii]SNV13418.1 Uncharacterised protein [Legionella waltersii]
MDKSRYSAISGFEKRKLTPFFPIKYLIVFITSVLFLAYLLFPGQQLLGTLLSMDNLSQVEYRYTMLIMPDYPGLTINPELLEKNPNEAVKRLKAIPERFTKEYSSKEIWLSYIALRTLTLSSDLPDKVKVEGKAGIKEYFKYFEKVPDLNSQQLKILARDALAIESSDWAMVFYDRIVKVYPDQSALFYGEMVKAATWDNQCVKSADMALIAKQKANSTEDKRYFFFLAIRSLFQCDQYALGMKLAQENLQDLSEDVTTYQLLIEYAIKAGDPKLANQFLLKLLELQGFSKKQQ